MIVNNNNFISSSCQCVVVPVSALYKKCKQVVIDIFNQLTQCFAQTMKCLKAYLWKVPDNRFPSSLSLHIFKVSDNVFSAPIPLSLSFGQGNELTLDVFIKHLLPRLPVQALHGLLLANKQFLTLLKNPNVLDQIICSSSDVDRFKLVSVLGPFLTEIHLGGDPWTDDLFIEFIQHCPNLTSIHFDGQGEMTDKSIIALVQACPKLTSVNLHFCIKMGYPSIQALAQLGSNLTNLTLSWSPVIAYAPKDRDMTENVMCSLAQKCPNLISVNLRLPNMTDKTILTLAENCPKLASVALIHLAKENIKKLALACPTLTELDVWSFYTDDVLEVLGARLPNLSKLLIHNSNIVTDAGVQALVKGCRRLTILQLKAGKEVTSKAMEAIAQNCPDLKYFHAACEGAIEDGIKVILRDCQHLQTLCLSESLVTPSMIQTLAENGQNLRGLALGSRNVTDEMVRKLAQTCRQIEELDLRRCDLISEQTLIELPRLFPKLKSLGTRASPDSDSEDGTVDFQTVLSESYPDLNLF